MRILFTMLVCTCVTVAHAQQIGHEVCDLVPPTDNCQPFPPGPWMNRVRVVSRPIPNSCPGQYSVMVVPALTGAPYWMVDTRSVRNCTTNAPEIYQRTPGWDAQARAEMQHGMAEWNARQKTLDATGGLPIQLSAEMLDGIAYRLNAQARYRLCENVREIYQTGMFRFRIVCSNVHDRAFIVHMNFIESNQEFHVVGSVHR